MVQVEAERIELGELVCRVAPLRNYSLLEMAAHLRRYVTCRDTVDVVIAELDSGLCDRVESALQRKGYPLDFLDVGHPAILFNRIANDKDLKYTDIRGYGAVLRAVKQQMVAKTHNRLYQICMEEDQERVRGLLRREQFIII